MSDTKTCATCGAPLPADAPEGAVCHACALEGQGTAALPEDFQPVTPPTRPTPSRTPSFSLPPGPIAATTIGDYEVTGKLGQGGMGAVYRATQISLGREVALKVLPAHFEADEDYVGRFQREAKVAASLSHPNLVRVYASGEADGSHYIAMELVEGENLRQRLKRGGLDMAEALRICTDVARGLQCGWQKAQLIHRDIKPSNIYLSHSGEVKLGDLGLAKSLSENSTGLTQTGAAMGTPHYMSPEQARGEKNLDFRADIYSLGCTLYELLTGAPPYSGTDGLTIINQHINAPIPAILKVMPSCPLPVARLVARMLKKNRHERPGSYEDLIAELENVRAQVEGGVTYAGPSAVVEAWKKGGDIETAPAASYGALWAGLALLLVVGGGAAWWALQPRKPATHLASSPPRSAPAPPSAPSITPRPAAPALPPPAPASAPASGWIDASTESPLLGVFANSPRTPRGSQIPSGANWRFPAVPLRSGAIKIRLSFGNEQPLDFKIYLENRAVYRAAFSPASTRLTYLSTSGLEEELAKKPGPAFTIDAPAVELLISREKGKLSLSIDGRPWLEAATADESPGRFTLATSPGLLLFVEKLEYLNRDGPHPTVAGGVVFGGHRYLFIPGPISWGSAKAKAESMGGHLVTITSKEEDEWLKETFGNYAPATNDNIHLGARLDAGQWKWITGEPFSYTGWQPGSPDHSADGDTLQYWRKNQIGWDDRLEASRDARPDIGVRGFIVEWDDVS